MSAYVTPLTLQAAGGRITATAGKYDPSSASISRQPRPSICRETTQPFHPSRSNPLRCFLSLEKRTRPCVLEKRSLPTFHLPRTDPSRCFPASDKRPAFLSPENQPLLCSQSRGTSLEISPYWSQLIFNSIYICRLRPSTSVCNNTSSTHSSLHPTSWITVLRAGAVLVDS